MNDEKLLAMVKASADAVRDARDLLDRASTSMMQERRNLETRALAANFYVCWERLTNNALTWYDVYRAPSDMILLRAIWAYPNTAGPKLAFMAIAPEGEALPTSLGGLNYSSRVIGLGLSTGYKFEIDIDNRPGGIVVPAGWIVRTMVETGGYSTHGRLDFAASTLGAAYKHYT